MRKLPAPRSECEVPSSFSPSHLVWGEHCPLRAVLGSQRGVPTLASHPLAAIGRAFHRLLELAVRGEIAAPSAGSSELEHTLDLLMQEERERLCSVWPAPVPVLSAVLPPRPWRQKRRVVLDVAERYLSGALPRIPKGSRSGGRKAEDLWATGVWSEVHMSNRRLRLAGRADVVERNSGIVRVRDLKTGRVATGEGEILPHIARQLRLYGVMAREFWPEDEVRLSVDDGAEHEVAFDQAER